MESVELIIEKMIMKRWPSFIAVYLIVAGCSIAQTRATGQRPVGPDPLPAGWTESNLPSAGPQQVAAKLEKDKVTVTIGGKLFTCYKFDASQKYPYFWPVNGPASEKSVTTETSQPYPHHHSLFFGCDCVNDGNYWQEDNERGQIVSQGPKIIEPSGDRVVFTDKCLWRAGRSPAPDQTRLRRAGKKPIILDWRRIVVSAPGEGLRFIDFEITLEPLTDVCILKTNHSLFSARVVPELSVSAGGTLINAEGKTGEKGTFGVASPWCDYSGTRGGVTEGIAILQHPGNRWFPAKWFTRDYGFFSPTPMFWLEGDKLELAKGERLTLRYRVVVHSSDAMAAKIGEIFEQYEQAAKSSQTQESVIEVKQ